MRYNKPIGWWMNIPKFIEISINSYFIMTFSLVAKYQLAVSYANSFYKSFMVDIIVTIAEVNRHFFSLNWNKRNLVIFNYVSIPTFDARKQTLCLNYVDFRVSIIVIFVVSEAKVIVIKTLCLDYVDFREAKSRGVMSDTRFQYDKGNDLMRLNSDIFCWEKCR